MSRKFITFVPVYVSYFLIIILLFQSTRPVQSIALSSLCGQFGHSCFGGNWGKRQLSEASIASTIIPSIIDTNNQREKIIIANYKNALRNLLLEHMRWSILQQRLNQLLRPQLQ